MSTPIRYLLDTNVLSETRRKIPDRRVSSFFSNTNPEALYISVLTLGELRKGVGQKMRSDPETAQRLADWVDGLEVNFSDHMVGVDGSVAKLWGDLSAQRPRPIVDTLLAATALIHDLTLVTRNVADLQDIPVKLLDPWTL